MKVFPVNSVWKDLMCWFSFIPHNHYKSRTCAREVFWLKANAAVEFAFYQVTTRHNRTCKTGNRICTDRTNFTTHSDFLELEKGYEPLDRYCKTVKGDSLDEAFVLQIKAQLRATFACDKDFCK